MMTWLDPTKCAENASLLSIPAWSNPWLVAAIGVSMALHLLILYIPVLAALFRCARRRGVCDLVGRVVRSRSADWWPYVVGPTNMHSLM